MPTDRRELALEAVKSLLAAERYFRRVERNSDLLWQECDDLPLALTFDGGEQALELYTAKVTPRATVSIVLVNTALDHQRVPTELNKMRAKARNALAAWPAQHEYIANLRYLGCSEPDIAGNRGAITLTYALDYVEDESDAFSA